MKAMRRRQQRPGAESALSSPPPFGLIREPCETSSPRPMSSNSSFKPTVSGRPVLSGVKTSDSVAQGRRLNFALG